MENLRKYGYILILLIMEIFIESYVFLKLWEWFVVTIFHTQAITIPQAMGIMLFVQYFKPKTKTNDAESFSILKFIESFLEKLGMSGFVLLIGWLITLFI